MVFSAEIVHLSSWSDPLKLDSDAVRFRPLIEHVGSICRIELQFILSWAQRSCCGRCVR